MSCCITSDISESSRRDEAACPTDKPQETNPCGSCNGNGRPVSRTTVLLMLKPDLIERAMHGSYSFCSARNCPIVYFEDAAGEQFTVDDLRIRVGLKVTEDPIPLCYCFGFDENHIRDEIERTGNTSIPSKVSGLIREGFCACETRNPSGMCCLGEVNKTANRLRETSQSRSTTK